MTFPSAAAIEELAPAAGSRTTAAAAAAFEPPPSPLLLKGKALLLVIGDGSRTIGFGAAGAGREVEGKPPPLPLPPLPLPPPSLSISSPSSPSPPPPPPSSRDASLSSPLLSLSHLLSPSLTASTTSLLYLDTMQRPPPPPPTALRSAPASNDCGERSAWLFAAALEIFAMSPFGRTAPVQSSSSLALASLQSASETKTSRAGPGARIPPTVAATVRALLRENRSGSYRDRQSCLEASRADLSREFLSFRRFFAAARPSECRPRAAASACPLWRKLKLPSAAA